jgi:hypothetical protein
MITNNTPQLNRGPKDPITGAVGIAPAPPTMLPRPSNVEGNNRLDENNGEINGRTAHSLPFKAQQAVEDMETGGAFNWLKNMMGMGAGNQELEVRPTIAEQIKNGNDWLTGEQATAIANAAMQSPGVGGATMLAMFKKEYDKAHPDEAGVSAPNTPQKPATSKGTAIT